MAGPITGNPPFGTWQQPGRWGRNETGNWTLWTYEGTKREVFLLAASFAETLGLVYEVTESFGKWRLDVRFPFNMNGIDPRTDKVDNWEFFASRVEKDLLDSKLENPQTVGILTPGQINTIRNFLLNPPDGSTNSPYPQASDFQRSNPPEDQASAGNALIIYNLMARGFRNFPVEAPALRHTIITSNQYAVPYALVNVRKILSTATLINSENLPAALLFSLPADVSTDQQYQYGWYKPMPTVQQIALLKWQIVQEYHYGLWSTYIWGTPL
jgi:hypothetical protein